MATAALNSVSATSYFSATSDSIPRLKCCDAACCSRSDSCPAGAGKALPTLIIRDNTPRVTFTAVIGVPLERIRELWVDSDPVATTFEDRPAPRRHFQRTTPQDPEMHTRRHYPVSTVPHGGSHRRRRRTLRV